MGVRHDTEAAGVHRMFALTALLAAVLLLAGLTPLSARATNDQGSPNADSDDFDTYYRSVEMTRGTAQTMRTSNGSRAVGVMLTVSAGQDNHVDEVRVMICFRPIHRFEGFSTEGYVAGDAVTALAIGMFDCDVKFNGTKFPQYRDGNSFISDVQYVTWTEDTVVAVTWGKYFYTDVVYAGAEEVFRDMTIAVANSSISNSRSSLLLKEGYPIVEGPRQENVWQESDGTRTVGEWGYSIGLKFGVRDYPWSYHPLSLFYAVFDSRADALAASDLDVVRLANKCQNTAYQSVLCADTLVGYSGKAGMQSTISGHHYTDNYEEAIMILRFSDSVRRLYVRAVPAIRAAQFAANSCGKNFDPVWQQNPISTIEAEDRRNLLQASDGSTSITCPQTDLGSLLLDPFNALVTTVYTFDEISLSAVLKHDLSWTTPVLNIETNLYDIQLNIALKAQRAGIRIYWGQVTQAGFHRLNVGGDPQLIVDGPNGELNSLENGSFTLPANTAEFEKTLEDVHIESHEAAYLYVAVEVDGILERKFHKIKVPSYDSLAFWTDGSPSITNAVLNPDGLFFTAMLSGVLSKPVYEIQITYAAIEYDSETWPETAGLVAKTYDEVTEMFRSYSSSTDDTYSDVNLQGGTVIDGGQTQQYNTLSFEKRLQSLDALKKTVYFFAIRSASASGSFYEYDQPGDVRNLTLEWQGDLIVPPPPPTFKTDQMACPELELFFQFDRFPSDQGFELQAYPIIPASPGIPASFYAWGGPAWKPSDIVAKDSTFRYLYEMCTSSAYILRVTDASSNGMCCGNGFGYYTLTLIKPNGARVEIKGRGEARDFTLEQTDFMLDVVLAPAPPFSPPLPSPPRPPPPPPRRLMKMYVSIKFGDSRNGLGFFYMENVDSLTATAFYRRTGEIPASALHSDTLADADASNVTAGDWFTFPVFALPAEGMATGSLVVYDTNNLGLGKDGVVNYTIKWEPLHSRSQNHSTFVSQFFPYPSGDSIGINVAVPYSSTEFAQLSASKPPSPPPLPPPTAVVVPPDALTRFPGLTTNVGRDAGVRILKEGAFVPWVYEITLESQPLILPVIISIEAVGVHHGRILFRVNDGAYSANIARYEINANNWNGSVKVTVRVPEDDIVEDSTPLSAAIDHGWDSSAGFISMIKLPVVIESNHVPGIRVTIPANDAYTNAPAGHAFNSTFDNASEAYTLTIEEGFSVTSLVALTGRARPEVRVWLKYETDGDSSQTTGITVNPNFNSFRLTDAALSFKPFNIQADEDNKVTGDRTVELRLETVSSLNSYGCEGAYSAFQTSVCGELYHITIRDNDKAGVQIGEIPPLDASLFFLWQPSLGERNASITEGISFGDVGAYSFGMTLRAEPDQDVHVQPVVTDLASGRIVTGQVVMSPLSVTFRPTQWDTPQLVQIMANADNTVEGILKYQVTWSMQSTDENFNNGAELAAALNVEVLDADEANITVVRLSATDRFSETGEPVRYSIRLSSIPTANVSLNFAPRISTQAAKMNASRRTTLMGQSPTVDTFIVINPPNIVLLAGSSNSVIFSIGFETNQNDRQVTGDIPIELVITAVTQDVQYTGLTKILDLVAGDEHKLGFVTEKNTESLLEEGGNDVTVGVKLASKPLSAIRLLLTVPVPNSAAAQIAIKNATSTGSAFDMTFTYINWDVFQYVNLTAIDDVVFEQVHSATVRLTGSLPTELIVGNVMDLYYANYGEDRVLLIEDNDLASAVGVIDSLVTKTIRTVTNVGARFPVGAVTVQSKFSIAELRVADIVAPMDVKQFKARASTVSFGPSTTFSEPVTIQIPLPTGLTDNSGDLHFVGASSATADNWAPVHGTVCENDTTTAATIASGKRVCRVAVDHFSLYTVATISSTVKATSCPGGVLTCADVAVTFFEDDPKMAIWPDATITILPGASPNTQNPKHEVSSIVVTVSNGYVMSEDTLSGDMTKVDSTDSAGCRFGKMPTGVSLMSTTDVAMCWNKNAGSLTISRLAAGFTLTLADARDALRQVRYINANTVAPNTQARRLTVRLQEPFSSGSNVSMSRYVVVVPVNDPPTVETTSSVRKYTEAADAVRVDPNIVIADVDSLLKSARVTMTPYSRLTKSTDIVLSRLGDSRVTGITHVVDTSVNGEYSIKFTGDASAALYQVALRSVTFQNDGPFMSSTSRTFTFSVTDLYDAIGTATRSLTIVKINNAPEVSMVPIPIFINEDQNATGSFAGATDCDKAANCIDNTLSFNVTCPPSKGTVYTTRNSASFLYVPNADTFGSDIFFYTAFDGELTSNLGSVQITINSITDNPRVSDLVLPLAPGKMTVCSASQKAELEALGDLTTCGGLVFTMPGSDPDDSSIGSNLEAYFIMTEPQYGTLTIAGSELTADSESLGAKRAGKNPAHFELTSSSLRGLEPASVNFTFRVKNAKGFFSAEGVVGQVTINLQHGEADNTPPTASADARTMSEDTVLSGNVPATDPDVGETLTLSIETQAASGTVVVVGDPTALAYSYTPDANFVGTDSFAYKVTDRRQGTSNAVITITVVNANDRPFGACQIPAGVPAATAALATAEVAKVKKGTSGAINLTPTATDHIFEGITAGMIDHQLAKQWLKRPPATSRLLDLDLLTGPLKAVGTRDEILKAWHIACGSTVFADGGSTSDRYLIALVGYDIEDSVIAAGTAGTARLSFVITEMPAVGKLHRVSFDASGFPSKGNEISIVPLTNVVTTTSIGSAGLLWYEPEVAYTGPIFFKWTVLDSNGLAAGGVTNVSSPEEYIFGTYFGCGPGYIWEGNVSTARGDERGGGAMSTASCSACPVGSINSKDTFMQLACQPCPRGEHQPDTAKSACLGCATGTFNPITGQSTCASCPMNDAALMTSNARSTSVHACVCQVGTFANSTGADKRCYACNPVTLCDETDQIIPKSLKDGYWIDPTNGEVIIQCSPPAACINHNSIAGVLSGNCSDGYVDNIPGCRVCEGGHYRELQGGYGYCVECPVTHWYVYAAGAVGLLLLMPLLMRASKLRSGFGAINIFISYAQVLSMFSKLEFNWPVSVTKAFRSLAFFNLDFFSLSPPECVSSDWTYISKFWITNSFPLLYIVGFGVIAICAYIHFRVNRTLRPLLHAVWPSLAELYPASGEDVSAEDTKRIKEELEGCTIVVQIWNNIGHSSLAAFTPLTLKRFLTSMAQAFLLFLLWGYFMLSESTLDYFDCVEGSDGKHYMRGDPAMECWNYGVPNLHNKLLPLAIFSILAYPIGIFLLFATLFYKYCHVLRQRSRLNAIMNPNKEEAETIEEMRKCERRFGFLFRRYEDEWFWWELVILARKLTYLMCGSLMTSPLEQLLTMILVLTAFCSVFLMARPYDKVQLDVMECISLISNLILMFAGFMFFSELLTEKDERFTAYGVQILLVTSLIVLAAFIVADTLPSVYWVWRALQNERKQAKLDDMREKSRKGNRIGGSGYSAADTGLHTRSLVANLARFRMIARIVVPRRIAKVLTAASKCFKKDVVDKLRGYLWMDGIGDAEILEVERFVYHVNNARLSVEARRLKEDVVTAAAAVARMEEQKVEGTSSAMVMEDDAPIRLGSVLNAHHADDFNQWLAFEAGADEQNTMMRFLVFFKTWNRYEEESNVRDFLGRDRGSETAAVAPSGA